VNLKSLKASVLNCHWLMRNRFSLLQNPLQQRQIFLPDFSFPLTSRLFIFPKCLHALRECGHMHFDPVPIELARLIHCYFLPLIHRCQPLTSLLLDLHQSSLYFMGCPHPAQIRWHPNFCFYCLRFNLITLLQGL